MMKNIELLNISSSENLSLACQIIDQKVNLQTNQQNTITTYT